VGGNLNMSREDLSDAYYYYCHTVIIIIIIFVISVAF